MSRHIKAGPTPGVLRISRAGSVILAQMNSDAALQQNAHGFAAGTTRYDTMPQIKDVVDVNAMMDVVISSDCTAEVQGGGERAFKQVVAVRKGPMVAMQKINEIVERVWPIPWSQTRARRRGQN